MSNITLGAIFGFILKNWFKFSLAALLLVLFFKKDLSFQVNVDGPQPQQVAPAGSEHKTRKPVYSMSAPNNPSPEVATASSMIGFSTTPSKPVVLSAPALSTVDAATKENYLQRFAKVATAEQKKYGIPASVILASAMINSTAGTFVTAEQPNNHFALPCDENWIGATAQIGQQCFRAYENAWTSFRNNSLYLTGGRFAALRDQAGLDYRKWATELQKLDYSRQPNFAQQMIQLIEAYDLARLDQ